VGWIRPLAQLLDESGLEETLDDRIQSAGTQANASARPFGDVLEDGIPMAVSVRERDENVKRVARERKEVLRLGALTASSRHAEFYQLLV
jgi:hypothetical protein